MTVVQIEWLQRVHGRHPGTVENLERTPLIDALAAQRRIRIKHVVEPPVFEAPAPAPILGVFVPSEIPNTSGGVDFVRHEPSEPVTTEAAALAAEDLSESELLGLTKPKPRPRKPKPVVE